MQKWYVNGGGAFDTKPANSFFSRLRGLMLSPRLPCGTALFINPCNSIYMCFMLFPIDAVFVRFYGDSYCVVVKVAKGVRPWGGFASCFGANAVLEFREGEADRLGLAEGAWISIPAF